MPSNEQRANSDNPQLAELVRRHIDEGVASGRLFGRTPQVRRLALMSFAAATPTPLHQITKQDVRAWLADTDVAAMLG